MLWLVTAIYHLVFVIAIENANRVILRFPCAPVQFGLRLREPGQKADCIARLLTSRWILPFPKHTFYIYF